MSTDSANGNPSRTALSRVDWSTEAAPAFTNGFHLLCGTDDVALVFTEFQPFEGRLSAAESLEPRERVVASVRMTPERLFQMLAGMGSVWNRFVLEHGKPDTTPRFRLFGARQFEQLDGTEEA